MKVKKSPVIGIKHNNKSMCAVLHNGNVIWKLFSFNPKDLSLNQPKTSWDATYGDILCVNKEGKLEIYSKKADFTFLQDNGIRPIATVICPGKFNIYGDCSVGCMAIKFGSSKNMKEGTCYEYDAVGSFGIDNMTEIAFPELCLDNNPMIVSNDSNELKGFIQIPVLASTYWRNAENGIPSIDGKGWYLRYGEDGNNKLNRWYGPSFYLPDEVMNPLWWYTETQYPKTSQNYLDSKEANQLYIDKFFRFNKDGSVDETSNWNYAKFIRYAIEFDPYNSNTKGQWYLPNPSECGIWVSRAEEFNDTITKLKSVYGEEIGSHNTRGNHLGTCCQFSDDVAINENNLICLGLLSIVLSAYGPNTNDYYCRPMIRFENTPNKVKININWKYIKSITINNRIWYAWQSKDFIYMPKGEILKWSVELIGIAKTEEPLYGEFKVENECTLGINDGYFMIPSDYVISSWEAQPGDILCSYDNYTFWLFNKNVPLEELKLYGYTPIAIVVTPGSHNVYNDCSVSCVSLNWGSNDNNNGTTTKNNTFTFSTNTTINNPPSSLLCTEGPIIVGPQNNTIKGFIERPCLPSTCLTESSTQSVSLDGIACYNNTKSESNPSMYWYSPSIYLEDGSMNPSWWYAEKDHQVTYQRSFNGYENTKTILDMGDKTQYPAAYCANTYYPKDAKGTVGKWYLSNAGELAYLITRIKELNKSLQNLIDVFGSDNICTIDTTSTSFVLSSLFSNGRYNNVSFSVLLFGNNGNASSSNVVRPFIKFNNTIDKVKVNLNFSDIDDILINNRHYYSFDNINSIYVKKGSTLKYKVNSSEMDGEEITLTINEEITIPTL